LRVRRSVHRARGTTASGSAGTHLPQYRGWNKPNCREIAQLRPLSGQSGIGV
jgi:hypothetical protein